MTDLGSENFYEDQLKKLRQKAENEKMKAEWEEAAQKLKIFYDSMIKAGFNEKQAWWFVTAAVRQSWGIS